MPRHHDYQKQVRRAPACGRERLIQRDARNLPSALLWILSRIAPIARSKSRSGLRLVRAMLPPCARARQRNGAAVSTEIRSLGKPCTDHCCICTGCPNTEIKLASS